MVPELYDPELEATYLRQLQAVTAAQAAAPAIEPTFGVPIGRQDPTLASAIKAIQPPPPQPRALDLFNDPTSRQMLIEKSVAANFFESFNRAWRSDWENYLKDELLRQGYKIDEGGRYVPPAAWITSEDFNVGVQRIYSRFLQEIKPPEEGGRGYQGPEVASVNRNLDAYIARYNQEQQAEARELADRYYQQSLLLAPGGIEAAKGTPPAVGMFFPQNAKFPGVGRQAGPTFPQQFGRLPGDSGGISLGDILDATGLSKAGSVAAQALGTAGQVVGQAASSSFKTAMETPIYSSALALGFGGRPSNLTPPVETKEAVLGAFETFDYPRQKIGKPVAGALVDLSNLASKIPLPLRPAAAIFAGPIGSLVAAAGTLDQILDEAGVSRNARVEALSYVADPINLLPFVGFTKASLWSSAAKASLGAMGRTGTAVLARLEASAPGIAAAAEMAGFGKLTKAAVAAGRTFGTPEDELRWILVRYGNDIPPEVGKRFVPLADNALRQASDPAALLKQIDATTGLKTQAERAIAFGYNSDSIQRAIKSYVDEGAELSSDLARRSRVSFALDEIGLTKAADRRAITEREINAIKGTMGIPRQEAGAATRSAPTPETQALQVRRRIEAGEYVPDSLIEEQGGYISDATFSKWAENKRQAVAALMARGEDVSSIPNVDLYMPDKAGAGILGKGPEIQRPPQPSAAGMAKKGAGIPELPSSALTDTSLRWPMSKADTWGGQPVWTPTFWDTRQAATKALPEIQSQTTDSLIVVRLKPTEGTKDKVRWSILREQEYSAYSKRATAKTPLPEVGKEVSTAKPSDLEDLSRGLSKASSDAKRLQSRLDEVVSDMSDLQGKQLRGTKLSKAEVSKLTKLRSELDLLTAELDKLEPSLPPLPDDVAATRAAEGIKTKAPKIKGEITPDSAAKSLRGVAPELTESQAKQAISDLSDAGGRIVSDASGGGRLLPPAGDDFRGIVDDLNDGLEEALADAGRPVRIGAEPQITLTGGGGQQLPPPGDVFREGEFVAPGTALPLGVEGTLVRMDNEAAAKRNWFQDVTHKRMKQASPEGPAIPVTEGPPVAPIRPGGKESKRIPLQLRFGEETLATDAPKMDLIDWSIELAVFPKASLAGMDRSFILRQAGMLVRRQKQLWSAVSKTMIIAENPEQAAQWSAAIKKATGKSIDIPDAESVMQTVTTGRWASLRQRAKVVITDYTYKGGLARREEQYQSKIADNLASMTNRLGLGVIGEQYRMGNRSFSVGLNKLRADVFDNIIEDWALRQGRVFDDPELRRAFQPWTAMTKEEAEQLIQRQIADGITPDPYLKLAITNKKTKWGPVDSATLREGQRVTDDMIRDLGNYVNWATGRGSLPPEIAVLMSPVFFAPRNLVSRFELAYMFLNPFTSNAVRWEMAKDLSAFMATGQMMLVLTKLAGGSVELDPRSADFGKGRFGDTRIDMWGGYQQIVRYLFQAVSEERKTATGQIVSDDGLNILWRYVRSKLSPSIGFQVDLMHDGDLVGDRPDFTSIPGLRTFAKNTFLPLFIQDTIDAYRLEGAKGLYVLPSTYFGLGATSYLKSPGEVATQVLHEQTRLSPDKWKDSDGKVISQWWQLTSAKKTILLRERPDLETYFEGLEDKTEVGKVMADRTDRLNDLTQQYLARGNSKKWLDEVREVMNDASGDFKAAIVGEKDREITKDQQMIQDYFKARDTTKELYAKGAFGPDVSESESLDRFDAVWRVSHTPQQAQVLDEVLVTSPNVQYQLYKSITAKIIEPMYWNKSDEIRDTLFTALKEDIGKLADPYTSVNSLKVAVGERDPVARRISDELERRTSDARLKMRYYDHRLDALLFLYGYVDTVITQEAANLAKEYAPVLGIGLRFEPALRER